MVVAQRVAKKYDKVVTFLPDHSERYLSMDLFKY